MTDRDQDSELLRPNGGTRNRGSYEAHGANEANSYAQPSTSSRLGNVSKSFQRFVAVQVGWMALVSAVLLALGLWDLVLFYTLSLVGLLSLRVVLVPSDRQQRWWRRLHWVARIGLLVQGYIVVQRALEML